MRLIAPANSIEEAKAVFHAGADGIYIGGVTTIYSNYPKPGEEWNVGENKLSVEEFERLIDYCKEKKKFVQFEVYTDAFSQSIENSAPDLIAYFKKYVEIGIQAGVDSMLFDDIGAIMKAQSMAPNLKLNASFLLDTINKAQVKFLESLNVNTIELSPQLSMQEILEIYQNSTAGLALISHLACAAFEGTCYMDHFLAGDEKLIPIGLPCKANYKVYRENDEVMECKLLEHTSSCSICALPELCTLDLQYLKIPGRHVNPELILEWTRVYRYALDLLSENKMLTADELTAEILKSFPRWRLWCRLNRNKRCLYEKNVRS